MFSFLMSASVGALLGGSYVLLRTPRTGKENQEFIKAFYQETRVNVENVQNKVSDVQAKTNDLQVEVAKLQAGPIPEFKHLADDFKTEAEVYTRRINDGIQEITQEVDAMQRRIEAKTDKLPVEKATQDSTSDSDK